MANPHYGAITDVWKHLPLAEVLKTESIEQYWESHAGRAHYPLTHSLERDYGVFHILRHAARSSRLDGSAYVQLLRASCPSRSASQYPGSPLIAMRVLRGRATQLLFCDRDGSSLESIETAAGTLGFDGDAILTAKADGPSLLNRALDRLHSDERERLLVFIDPFNLYEHLVDHPNSIQTFARVACAGVKVLLWYHFFALDDREWFHKSIRTAFLEQGSGPETHHAWYAEIAPDPFPNPRYDFNEGCVRGCGIAGANLSSESRAACVQLGRGLVEIYEQATLPDDVAGALGFRYESL